MTPTFSTTETGDWAWSWTEPDDPRVHREIVFSHQRGGWLSRQKVDPGGWTVLPLPDWEQPADRVHAEQIVHTHFAQRSLFDG